MPSSNEENAKGNTFTVYHFIDTIYTIYKCYNIYKTFIILHIGKSERMVDNVN